MNNIKCPESGQMIVEEEEKLPPILYQYTTMDVLYGMLKDVNLFLDKVDNEGGKVGVEEIKLRASLATYMNDPSEFDYLVEEVRNKYRNKEGHINSVSREMTSQWMFYYGPFVRSFSKNKDSLPMWNEYGQKGKGVAIGFDTSILQSSLKEAELQGEKWHFKRCKYGYNKKKVEKEILGLAKLNKETFTEGEHLYNHDKAKWKEYNEKTEAFLLDKRAITKHKAYEYEKEWRLYKILPKPLGELRINESRYVHEYRESNGLIIPYEEILIPVSAIKEIVIGPTAHIDRTYNSLQMFLESRGLAVNDFGKQDSVHIVNSKVPYTLL